MHLTLKGAANEPHTKRFALFPINKINDSKPSVSFLVTGTHKFKLLSDSPRCAADAGSCRTSGVRLRVLFAFEPVCLVRSGRITPVILRQCVSRTTHLQHRPVMKKAVSKAKDGAEVLSTQWA